MSDVAIRCEGLAKQYRIGERQRYNTLRDKLASAASAPFRRLRPSNQGSDAQTWNRSNDPFWALNDVSFEVNAGDVVGVIGRNGAGKSTLLKILSRITEPTKGRVEIHGRVGSLLEVGTGFNSELTGRENVYLNGAILGMRKAEIDRRFDEIVAFAEVEKFVDTPVKRYSSGMYLRLAFAVAAHLESEILLVDEVLAVGDAEFQRKCLDKMQEVGNRGRTILFVSHNLSAVRTICTRGLLVNAGTLAATGDIDRIADAYLASILSSNAAETEHETESFVIHDVSVTSPGNAVIKSFAPLHIIVTLTPKTFIADPGLYVGILTSDNQRLAGVDFKDFRSAAAIMPGERTRMGFVIEELPLLHGRYQLEIHVKDMASHKIESVPEVYPFEVVETPVYGGRKLDRWFGCIGLKANATFNKVMTA